MISHSPLSLQVLCCYWRGCKITQMSKVFSGSAASPINIQSNAGLAAHTLITSSWEREGRERYEQSHCWPLKEILKKRRKAFFFFPHLAWILRVCMEDWLWCCIHLKLLAPKFWPSTTNKIKKISPWTWNSYSEMLKDLFDSLHQRRSIQPLTTSIK